MSENTHLVDPWPTVSTGPTMTIEEAINMLGDDIALKPYVGFHRIKQAQLLGIEALKRLQDNRRDPEFDHWVPLPGETQEEE